jgi:hypothetical protein
VVEVEIIIVILVVVIELVVDVVVVIEAVVLVDEEQDANTNDVIKRHISDAKIIPLFMLTSYFIK